MLVGLVTILESNDSGKVLGVSVNTKLPITFQCGSVVKRINMILQCEFRGMSSKGGVVMLLLHLALLQFLLNYCV